MGVGGKRHTPVALPPGKKHSIHHMRGWVGSRAGLDECGKFRPHRDSIPGHPACSESLYRLSYRVLRHRYLVTLNLLSCLLPGKAPKPLNKKSVFEVTKPSQVKRRSWLHRGAVEGFVVVTG